MDFSQPKVGMLCTPVRLVSNEKHWPVALTSVFLAPTMDKENTKTKTQVIAAVAITVKPSHCYEPEERVIRIIISHIS